MAQAIKRAEPGKSGLVNLRISPDDRNIIDRAARAAGKTRTEFMVEAARRAAHDTLLDMTLVLVDHATFGRFKQALDAPINPHPGLRALVSQKAPWDS
jgi:uncharacterized protein (DUF1778 family)